MHGLLLFSEGTEDEKLEAAFSLFDINNNKSMEKEEL